VLKFGFFTCLDTWTDGRWLRCYCHGGFCIFQQKMHIYYFKNEPVFPTCFCLTLHFAYSLTLSVLVFIHQTIEWHQEGLDLYPKHTKDAFTSIYWNYKVSILGQRAPFEVKHLRESFFSQMVTFIWTIFINFCIIISSKWFIYPPLHIESLPWHSYFFISSAGWISCFSFFFHFCPIHIPPAWVFIH